MTKNNEVGGQSVGPLRELLFVREVEQFLFHEVGLLDDRRFEDWTDLFTEDGYYWAPAEINRSIRVWRIAVFDDVLMMRISSPGYGIRASIGRYRRREPAIRFRT